MAQDLLNISPESFEIQANVMKSKDLVTLLRQIYDFKYEKGKMMPYDKILDLERKETKIMKILMSRKYLNKQNSQEYQQFLNKINFKKRLY